MIMSRLLFSLVLLTEPAIGSLEALKLISLIGLAAILGPLVIGGLFFILKSK